jgi:hypothetical protein
LVTAVALVFVLCWGLVSAAGGQAVATQQSAPIKVPPAPAEPGELRTSYCVPLANRYVAMRSTIEAKVPSFLDPGHLKAGKKIWAQSLVEDADSACRILKDAVIYGSVTLASTSKTSGSSELGLQFDHVDCLGKTAQPMKLTVIAIVAPESWRSDTVHDALPGQGGGVNGAWAYGWDQRLDPGGPPNFVYPGEVVGFKKISLDPRGGPRCSALVTSQDARVELGPGTILILALADSE